LARRRERELLRSRDSPMIISKWGNGGLKMAPFFAVFDTVP
jgi:hypothetical protein